MTKFIEVKFGGRNIYLNTGLVKYVEAGGDANSATIHFTDGKIITVDVSYANVINLIKA